MFALNFTIPDIIMKPFAFQPSLNWQLNKYKVIFLTFCALRLLLVALFLLTDITHGDQYQLAMSWSSYLRFLRIVRIQIHMHLRFLSIGHQASGNQSELHCIHCIGKFLFIGCNASIEFFSENWSDNWNSTMHRMPATVLWHGMEGMCVINAFFPSPLYICFSRPFPLSLSLPFVRISYGSHCCIADRRNCSATHRRFDFMIGKITLPDALVYSNVCYNTCVSI